ncbi:zinc finger MYM-type protein 1-like isoform X1 [Eupeodes corollae]|uniref:zinc finger MYM-type protein 1-like isoform X1 n=1 Tax=Eupeodes corollae TaxID=290404 RepID=UPI00248F8907|nr:zinc finger MYM-type protein 1-like isoform X1 [Eupeodes corollae]
MRHNSETRFGSIFTEAKEMADKMGLQLVVPRIIAKQTKRDNYAGSPEEYFRRSVYVPFLDHLLVQLKCRFLDHRELISKIQNILPDKCCKLHEEEMKRTVEVFTHEWPDDIRGCFDDFLAEMRMWRRHCLSMSDEKRPKNFIDALSVCDASLYKTVHRYMQIGATLPVSVATSERSFSCLRRLKTYLRSKTGEERLNGLMLLNIYK